MELYVDVSSRISVQISDLFNLIVFYLVDGLRGQLVHEKKLRNKIQNKQKNFK